MSDAIIVLARGVEQNGTLMPDSLARVKKAVELYKGGQAPRIVMSGSFSFHVETKPARTEAEAMKQAAIDLGVPADDIIEEISSKDTLGNAYFTKKNICEPKTWHSLTVVTSEDHMARSQYVFNKVYGPEYQIEYAANEQVIDDKKYRAELEHEAESLTLTRKWLDPIRDGDDAAIWLLMIARHPAYMTK